MKSKIFRSLSKSLNKPHLDFNISHYSMVGPVMWLTMHRSMAIDTVALCANAKYQDLLYTNE